ncbi:ABC transporter substrate-binding protein [Citreimonas sp.]|uniref:ABC transporter substrate-binding protein n=1 Tax=Citreimonas sp. TaxID=3036715 RepID=UPI00405A0FE1
MAKTVLKTATRIQGNNRSLQDGSVTAPDFAFDIEEVNPLPRAFRRMVREGAYDVSEMALTTYITAKAHGAKLTALPIFLVRDFHHKSMAAHEGAISGPKDLEGRRVGVNRGYTVTTGVWARAILAQDFGVDLSQVTWARSDDEHVPDWPKPANVEELGGDGTLEEQLARGDIAAAVGLPAKGAGLVPIVENAFQAGFDALKTRGFYPINHLVVVRDDVLDEAPDVAVQVFDAFAAAKALHVQALREGRVTDPSPVEKVELAALEVMDDPLPYGIAPNLNVLELLMAQVVAQGIIDAPMPIADLFAPSVRDRIA